MKYSTDKIKEFLKRPVIQVTLVVLPAIVFGMREQINDFGIPIYISIIIYLVLQILGVYLNVMIQFDVAKYKALKDLTHKTDILSVNKHGLQLKRIVQILENSANPVEVYSQPQDIINNILTILKDSMCTFFGIEEDHSAMSDVHISIYYKFPQDKTDWDWKLTIPIGESRMSNIHEEKIKIFRDLKQPKPDTPNIYWKYINNITDKCGSLACYRITLRNASVVYIEAVISVATYEQQFSKINKRSIHTKNIEENMKNVFSDIYESQICIELCNFYMTHLWMKYGDPEQRALKNMRSSLSKWNSMKIVRQLQRIAETKEGKKLPAEVYSQANDMTNTIQNILEASIISLLNINESRKKEADLRVHMYYRFVSDRTANTFEDWISAESLEKSTLNVADLSKKDNIEGRSSTFKYLLDECKTRSYVFFIQSKKHMMI